MAGPSIPAQEVSRPQPETRVLGVKHWRTLLLPLFLTGLLAAQAIEIMPSRTAPDYRLTLPKLEKFRRAVRALAEVSLANQAAFFERGKTNPSTDTSVEGMAKQMETVYPEMAQAVTKAGMPPLEFYRFFSAYVNAGLVAAMQKNDPPKTQSPSAVQDNIRFVLTHEAECNRLNQEVKAMEQAAQKQ